MKNVLKKGNIYPVNKYLFRDLLWNFRDKLNKYTEKQFKNLLNCYFNQLGKLFR